MTWREVGAEEAVALAQAGTLVIDVREATEWRAGHVAGAVHVPLGEVGDRVPAIVPDRDAPLLVYCAVGVRSAHAAEWLSRAGYSRVASLRASLDDWRRAGGGWVAEPSMLDEHARRRYARQIPIPEVGEEGQRRLLDSRVLLVGAGGLGSPVALYLAAAGVGTIGLVDDDVVDASNLQRQVVHSTDRIGLSKTESAERTLAGLNPDVRVVRHDERMVSDNVDALITGYDVIVDGSDNLETRYLLNDAMLRARIPVVHGSVYRWDGQVTTFLPFDGPCYRCLHPEPPPPELAPACDVAGVMGVLPGIIGLLQATEALKVLLGVGRSLSGRLLMVDALEARFEEVAFARDPGCPACGRG